MDTSATLSKTVRQSNRRRVLGALRIVSPMAWALAGGSFVVLFIGRWLGWIELTTLAATIIVLLTLSIVFTLGRTNLEVLLELKPERVTAGQRAAAAVVIRNVSGRRITAARMEVVVGVGVAEFRVPSLATTAEHEELFVLPTVRRGVIPVGPVASVRSDPLGLLRRSQVWTGVTPLIVHPVTVSLAQLGTGFVRDLEGRATNDISNSDVAFHTLREYVPGDEQRHIHWLTTAKTGSIMIRQFIETRRSHVGIALDGAEESFQSEAEYELAVSVVGSLGVRIQLDDQQLTTVAGSERIPTSDRNAFLDALSMIEVGNKRSGIAATITGLLKIADGLSLAIVITGSAVGIDELRKSAARFTDDIRVLVIRVDPGTPTSFQPLGRQWLLSLAALDDLAHLLWAAAA